MTERGYRQLEIYQLARSLAMSLHRITWHAGGGLPFERAFEIRRVSKALVGDIVTAYGLRHNPTALHYCLRQAIEQCERTLALLSASRSAAFLPDDTEYHYICSSYGRLRSLLETAAATDPASPDSPLRVSEEPVPYEASAPPLAGLLEGKSVLVTRPREQSDEILSLLERSGAYGVQLPTIEIADPESWLDCDRAILGLEQYSGVLFTSRNAVEKFTGRIRLKRPEALEILAAQSVYAVGERTAQALAQAGVSVALTPEVYSAEELAHSLGRKVPAGKRFLFPRGNIARDTLPVALRSLHAVVDEVVVYRTISPPQGNLDSIRESLLNSEIDVVTFLSPSSVRNFVQMMGTKCLVRTVIAAIGPTTARASEDLGLRVDCVSQRATVEGLLQSVAAHFQRSASPAPQPLS